MLRHIYEFLACSFSTSMKEFSHEQLEINIRTKNLIDTIDSLTQTTQQVGLDYLDSTAIH